MKYLILTAAFGVMSCCHGDAQTTSVVGTISAFKAEVTEIEVKPDSGAPVGFKVTGDTVAQKVAPGAGNLTSAQTIRVTELHLGDRVLATPEPGTKMLRRIVVMSASDLALRDEADRADWARRGVSGIVATKTADGLTLKMRSLTGVVETIVKVSPKTTYRQYAPDSVRFADAKQSSLSEIAVGAQVRARGEKGSEGAVVAEEIVFGSFTTRAGVIASVDAVAHEVTVKELTGGKPLTIRITADSQVKRMLDRQAMIEMMHGSGAAEHAPPRMTLSEMLERLPVARLEDLKVNDTVIVSSTRGVKADQVTAISMLANAEMLLQVMSMQSANHGGTGVASPAAGLEALSSMGFGVVQ
ncbi:MAG TPA: hypothetical protein VNV86_02805 [Candidatus Acidoferrum sp.]|nr:hypothetical protein [Candidatus Acidoferrum sp.]